MRSQLGTGSTMVHCVYAIAPDETRKREKGTCNFARPARLAHAHAAALIVFKLEKRLRANCFNLCPLYLN